MSTRSGLRPTLDPTRSGLRPTQDPTRSGLRPTLHRTGWTIADQAVSSGTTFLVVAFLARRSDATGFGALSVLLSLTVLTLGIGRALGTDALMVRHAAETVADQHPAARRAVGTNLAVGLLSGAVLLMSSTAVGSPLRGALVVGGVAMPALALQDGWRFVFVSAGRPRAAVLNDAIWTATFLLALAMPWSRGDLPVAALAGIWASGGVLAAAAGFLQFGGTVRIDPWRWVLEHRGLSLRFAAEFVLLSGVNQLIMLAVARWQGLAESGSMRAAALLLGPASVLANGVLVASVPEGARLRAAPRTASRLIIVFALVSAVTMVGAGLVMSHLPDAVGELILGGRWADARELVLVMSIFYAGANVVMVGAAGLRALGGARQSLRLIASLTVVLLVGGAAGARQGAFAANVGLAVPAWAGAVVCLVVLHRFASRAAAQLDGGAPRPSGDPADSRLEPAGR